MKTDIRTVLGSLGGAGSTPLDDAEKMSPRLLATT